MQKTIESKEILEKINNKENIYYENAIIKGNLDFTNLISQIRIGKNMYRSYIDSVLVFENCIFEDKIIGFKKDGNDLYFTTFLKDLNFSNSRFNNSLEFIFTHFQTHLDFSYATFNDKVQFREAIFSGYADFTNANFSKETGFIESFFTVKADFKESTFKNKVDFSQTHFIGFNDFENAKFLDKIDLSETKFIGTSKGGINA